MTISFIEFPISSGLLEDELSEVLTSGVITVITEGCVVTFIVVDDGVVVVNFDFLVNISSVVLGDNVVLVTVVEDGIVDLRL